MSQLQMLSDNAEDCLFWGEKAIAIARELNDEEILSHALNNVGDVYMRIPGSKQKGTELLQQSLDLALKNSYHEHAARAYTNLGSSALLIKENKFAKEIFEQGIQYCEERDLDSWSEYMLSEKARLYLKTGHWNEAYEIATDLLKDDQLSPIIKHGAFIVVATIHMRKGDGEVLSLLYEAKNIAFKAMELQRIVPAMVALLEYEWLTNKHYIEEKFINETIALATSMGNVYDNSEFAFWLSKARQIPVELKDRFEGYELNNSKEVQKAATLWRKFGCPYEEAIVLFEGDENNKKNAAAIVQKLGADAVYEKMKFLMRNEGIKSIPRGIRKSTRSNPSNLTDREIDVLQLLKEGLQNKEIADKLFISPKTVDHHISSIFYKLEVNSRAKAVQESSRQGILK